MKRREAIVLLGGAVIAPLLLYGQSSSRVWRIGVLETTPINLNAANINAFRQSLQDLGYVEGQNLIIAYRSAEGRGGAIRTRPALRAGERAREIIEEFSLGSIASPVRTTASALAVIMPILPTSELVWLGRHGAA
jgi:hypothetical protein